MFMNDVPLSVVLYLFAAVFIAPIFLTIVQTNLFDNWKGLFFKGSEFSKRYFDNLLVIIVVLVGYFALTVLLPNFR